MRNARQQEEGGDRNPAFHSAPGLAGLTHVVLLLKLSREGLDAQFDRVECADERGGGKKVSGELVVSGSNTPPILDAAEVFDIVPAPVDALDTVGFLRGIAAAGDELALLHAPCAAYRRKQWRVLH